MKKVIFFILLSATTLSGCDTSDEDIRADIAAKARKDLNFAGLNYTVKNGVVNIDGRCASGKAFATVKQAIRNIHPIKAVNYNVLIAPVTLDTLTVIKLQVDSILANYPQVRAKVNVQGITLMGFVNPAKRSALIQDTRLKVPGNVTDSTKVVVN